MATKYLDDNGLLYLWQKIRTTFVSDVTWDSTNKKLVKKKKTGTNGAEQSTDLVTFATVATSGSYNDLSNKPTIPTLQNAFGNVKVGSTTIAADSTTDTLELVAGDNVTLTPDATNDKVTIAATDTTYSDATTSTHGLMSTTDKAKLDGISGSALDIVAGTNVTVTPDTTNGTLTIASSYVDTKNTAGSTDSSSKLFLVGATSQAANPQTYSQDTAYVGTDGHLYSNSKQTVNLSDSQALTNKTYNGYTLGAACAKGVVTSISSDSTDIPTVTAVKQYVSTAVAGGAAFQGTAPTTFAPTNYSAGWYWVVGTAGTYAGQTCEAGDMIFATANYNTAYSASDFDVIQTNLDITSISNSDIDTIVAA